jgi:tetratricopeptide (TPR) repeat protein
VGSEADTIPETIGQRLRRLRVERGLSQRELSAPGVSYAYISRIEAGARRPSVKALRLLARKLGVSAEYLETGSEIHDFERRELRLSEAELGLRLGSDGDGAVAQLEEVLAEAIGAGDAAAGTRARVGLGFAAYERGDHARAAKLLDEAVGLGLLSPASRPDVFATLGRAWAALGQAEQAVALFERCREQLQEEAPGDDAAAVRFAAYLSHALTDLGDLSRAHEVLRDAVKHSDRLADPFARIRLYWSLGRVAANEGRSQVALNYFRRAVSLLEATEDTYHLARAHLSCAWALIENGETGDAGAHLEAAERLFGAGPEAVDVVMLRRLQGSLTLLNGDHDTAVARAREALQLAGESLPHERGQAWFVVAEAQAAQGSVAEAEHAYAEAAALLDQHGTPRARAACYRAWGRLLRESGREADALDVLERATDFAAELRSNRAATGDR